MRARIPVVTAVLAMLLLIPAVASAALATSSAMART